MIAKGEAEWTKALAEVRFEKRREQERTAQAGRAAEEARSVAEREKTIRLRALRLAKEEADRATAAATQAIAAEKKAPRKRKAAV